VRPLAAVEETRVAVLTDSDIVTARLHGREMAVTLGFPSGPATLIATAISELARNILLYARRGDITLTPLRTVSRRGLMVMARDSGPGIPDVEKALQDGYSTSGRLGLGLPGVRRLMDEFSIDTKAGRGTTVVVKIWVV
jgi:serine/threonine-protein kinase RsbT